MHNPSFASIHPCSVNYFYHSGWIMSGCEFALWVAPQPSSFVCDKQKAPSELKVPSLSRSICMCTRRRCGGGSACEELHKSVPERRAARTFETHLSAGSLTFARDMDRCWTRTQLLSTQKQGFFGAQQDEALAAKAARPFAWWRTEKGEKISQVWPLGFSRCHL
jgi:hypothetical protein